jgi:hypothetical protein
MLLAPAAHRKFRLAATPGSGNHYIYKHPLLPRAPSLLPPNREAKPFQISQVLDMVREFGLTIEHRK